MKFLNYIDIDLPYQVQIITFIQNTQFIQKFQSHSEKKPRVYLTLLIYFGGKGSISLLALAEYPNRRQNEKLLERFKIILLTSTPPYRILACRGDVFRMKFHFASIFQ